MAGTEWLANLKVGDEVVIRPWGTYALGEIAKVEKRLPSGRIVADGRTFNPDGRERTGASYYDRHHIDEPTPEYRAKIETAKLVARFRNVVWEKLPLETLRSIAALVQ